MRIIGLDYGTVRIGVAISDPSAIIAQPQDTLMLNLGKSVWKQSKPSVRKPRQGRLS